MISQISQALEKGFSEDQILDFVVKKFPKYASKIAGAKFAGFNASQILNTLLGDKIKRENVRQPTTEYEETRSGDIQSQENRNRIAKTGLALGATALAAPTALGALQRAIPNSLQTLAPSLLANNIGQDQQLIPTDNPQQPPSLGNASLPQQTQPVQHEVISNPKEYLEKLGVLDRVKSLLKAGNTPEGVAAAIGLKRSGESKIDPELLKNIEEFAKNPQETSELQPKTEKLAETPKIEKKSIVATPDGVGEVREIRNGQAIVDVDGKLHKVKEEELEVEPEEIRELDLEGPVSEYLSRIPESQKSSVIDVSLYDPTTNELQIRFPNGDQWVYSDIPEEVFDKINSMTGIPVSSGESKLRGTIWESGVANSAGADFYNLIKKLVKEGKIKERKLKTGIDLFKGFTSVKKRK